MPLPHRLEARIETRPGGFAWAVRSLVHDNEKRTPKKRYTHVQLVCEICQQEETTTIGSGEVVAQRFDSHDGCKPKEEWPEEKRPAPRQSPLERAADRARIRQEAEDEGQQ